MENLKTIKEVNSYFKDWSLLGDTDRLTTIKNLKERGRLQASSSSFSKDFTCPIHQFPLLKPCNLETCQYHISAATDDLHEHRNCLINRLDKSKGGKLSLQEIANVLGVPLPEVSDINEKAIVKIKKAFIKDKVEKLKIVRYKYLEGHCVSCGMNLADELEYDDLEPELIIELKKFGWCSVKCKTKKPKWQFLIENEFNCFFMEVLAVSLKTYDQETVELLYSVPEGSMRPLKSQLNLLVEDLF